jgi:divalent metal cation (Fe/Co/Zn/Cd) transporter
MMLLLFEVMDKEPPISVLWAMFVIVGLIGCFLSYWKWPLSVISILVTLFLTWAHITEFHDEQIYRHIWREEPTYLPQFYTAVVISFAPPFLGILLRRRRSRAAS